MCGADRPPTAPAAAPNGSSPRVRSRPCHNPRTGLRTGIISACAEQTTRSADCSNATWDHLRVCGADHIRVTAERNLAGSSPRVRSRPAARTGSDRRCGIISACAEQTVRSSRPSDPTEDHLRVCGADRHPKNQQHMHLGSSPRVRSRLP